MKKGTKKKEPKEKFHCLRKNECERLGYCVIALERERANVVESRARNKAEAPEKEIAYRKSKEFIGTMIPVDASKDYQHLDHDILQHLQIACTAYHEQDYDTALYNATVVIKANPDCDSAYIVAAVAAYYSGKYEDACDYADKAAEYSFNYTDEGLIKNFKSHCFNFRIDPSLAQRIYLKEHPINNALFDVKTEKKTPADAKLKRRMAYAGKKEKAYRMEESFIGNLVPLNVIMQTEYNLGEYSRQHLQTAFDAYHQGDFETAILHCKAVMQATDNCGHSYICIAVSEYYLGNYEEASYYADRGANCYENIIKNQLENFSLHCVNLYREKSIAIEIPSTPVKEKSVQLDLFTTSTTIVEVNKSKEKRKLVEASV